MNKAFVSVEFNSATNDLTISFEDGSKETADILFGADGIHSAVRRFFVPSSNPQWTGWTAFRSIFAVDLLEALDPAVIDEANHWWGPDRTFFASRLGKDLFTIVGGYYSDPDAPNAPYKDATWNSEGDVNVLRGYYRDWHPVVRTMVAATPYTRQYPNTAAPGLDCWVFGNGRITLAGDAAHAHGGALAAGGSLAIDDAYAFAASLRHVFPPSSHIQSKAEIPHALSLFERTRKPHTDRVINMIREGNKNGIARLRRDDRETDEELRARIRSRSDPSWIHEHDVEAAFAQAVAQDMENSPLVPNLLSQSGAFAGCSDG